MHFESLEPRRLLSITITTEKQWDALSSQKLAGSSIRTRCVL